ncbi:MAG: restriction endonuclease subunit S [Deltaproteobacteria bacterium]|nr:restriction endonuclease subunit S [Deltaproteobacteria bacterium]
MAGEWIDRRIGTLGRIMTGKTPSTSDPANFGGPYPFITIPDLDGSVWIDRTARTLSDRGAQTMRSCLLPRGAVMMSCIATVGRCGITTRPSFTNQQINSVIPAAEADPRFLYYVFTQLGQELDSAGGGGSVYTNVSKSRFSEIEISLPVDVNEQRAIAHILGTLDDKIEQNRRMNETLEAMARALFKSWFVDFDPVRAKAEGRDPGLPKHIADLFPDSFEDSELGEIPKGWTTSSIYAIADVVYGAPFASAQFNAEGVGSPLIRIRDLADESPGVWTPEVHPKGYKVRPGDIVVGMDGEFRAYLWGGVEAWLNQRVCIFNPKRGVSPAFVRNSITDLLAQVEATETATTVIHLGKSDIDRFLVVVPTSPVLATFNRSCQPWYDRIVAGKRESRALAALRDTLLPKLISGELRLKGSYLVAVGGA